MTILFKSHVWIKARLVRLEFQRCYRELEIGFSVEEIAKNEAVIIIDHFDVCIPQVFRNCFQVECYSSDRALSLPTKFDAQ